MKKIWVKVGLTEAQKEAADALAKEGLLGGSRSEVFVSLLVRAVKIETQVELRKPTALRVVRRGPLGIQVIKTIRMYAGLPLKDAKDASEDARAINPIPPHTIEAFFAELQRVGADVVYV